MIPFQPTARSPDPVRTRERGTDVSAQSTVEEEGRNSLGVIKHKEKNPQHLQDFGRRDAGIHRDRSEYFNQ